MTTNLLDRPGIEDDATRREFVTGLIAAGLLTACGRKGGDGPSAAPPPADAGPRTRTITHFAGVTEVPVDAKRIVTLQDQNALLPLLELGVKPVASAGALRADGTKVFRRTQDLDTSGIDWIGEIGKPNLEAVAAARPDLIVCDEFEAKDVYGELSKIAPTVFVQVFGRALTEGLLAFADVVGKRARAEELQAGYRARVEKLKASLADRRERLTLSMINPSNAGAFRAVGTGQAVGTVMGELRLLRPAPQRTAAAGALFSFEQLSEHDGDVLLVFDFSGDVANSSLVKELVGSPLYAVLAAARAGQAHVLDATRFVGSAWARMTNFMGELERLLLAPSLNLDLVKETP